MLLSLGCVSLEKIFVYHFLASVLFLRLLSGEGLQVHDLYILLIPPTSTNAFTLL